VPVAGRRTLLILIVSAAAVAWPPRATGQRPDGATQEPPDARLSEIRERRRALAAELERLRGQERTLLGEVERLDLEVSLRGEELAETQSVLRRVAEQLESTNRRARQLEASLELARPRLAARARALYKLGQLSYLRLLLSVERPSDMLRGYRLVTALARRDNERIAQFRGDLQALTRARAELLEKNRQATALRADLSRARLSLDADRRRKEKLLTEIVEKKETHARYVQELEEAETRLGHLLQGLAPGDLSMPLGAFRGALPWPVEGRVRAGFGRRKHPRFDTYTLQNGIDIEAALAAPVRAVHEGTVVFADRFQGYGLMVIVDHGGKHHSLYAHLADVQVRVGQHVVAGETLGRVGTGLEGPGLYFEMRVQGRPEDPADWLKPAS
jgi:murein hydrolase activator